MRERLQQSVLAFWQGLVSEASRLGFFGVHDLCQGQLNCNTCEHVLQLSGSMTMMAATDRTKPAKTGEPTALANNSACGEPEAREASNKFQSTSARSIGLQAEALDKAKAALIE